MHFIKGEIKKSLHLPFFIISCIGVVFVCLISEGYVSFSGKTYTIMELMFFLNKEAMLTDTLMNRYDIWVKGIGTWTQLLIVFFLSIGYLYTISNEKQTGFSRFLLIRESNFKYAVSKLFSAMFSGGVIMLTGYMIFGIIIFARFPAINEYPPADISVYMEMHPDFNEPLFCLMRCMGAFLYGMCVNLFAYLAAVFFVDKYILICLPIMLKYIWRQVVIKIQNDALVKENEFIINLSSVLSWESLLDINQYTYKNVLLSLAVAVLIYLLGFLLTLYLLKRKGAEFGFE